MVILANTKLKDALKEYPQLKEFLISLNQKFKKLNNKFVFNVVKNWTTFKDIANIGGYSICELLHKVNAFIGKEDELFKMAPECIKQKENLVKSTQAIPKPRWINEAQNTILMDVRFRDDFFLQEILEALQKLDDTSILKIINSFYPAPLVGYLKEEGYEYYYESKEPALHILYIKAKAKNVDFVMDVRGWREDPFPEIIKKLTSLKAGQTLQLIQIFLPTPLINMVEPMGFEVKVEKINPFRYHIFFTKKQDKDYSAVNVAKGQKLSLVIQSATPVVYPIIMRLLQSKRLLNMMTVKELKVWDETEKHLGWIVNKKADISFSAVAAITKLYQQGFDILMNSIVVWDNFFLLTYGFKASDFGDLKGIDIYVPLITTAPPATITKYFIEKESYNFKDFRFKFGDPFGRPKDIKEKLVRGEITAGVIREPEASFAIYEGKGKVYESIKYKDLWNKFFPGYGSLPNAGLVFKKEIIEKYPDFVEVFMEELENAVLWVNQNKDDAAKLSYDIMGVPQDEALFFLNRVTLDFKKTADVKDNLKNYINVLKESGYSKNSFDDIKELFVL